MTLCRGLTAKLARYAPRRSAVQEPEQAPPVQDPPPMAPAR